MSDADERVSQFLAFTGCSDPDRATSYLEMSGNDLQTAVGLYMEHMGGGGGGSGSGGDGGGLGGVGGAAGSDDLGAAIRAPDRTRTMRLMDDVHPMGAMGYEMLMQNHDTSMFPSAFAREMSDVRATVNAAAAAAESKENAGAFSDEMDEDDEDYKYDYDDDDDDDDNDEKGSGPPVPSLQDLFSPPDHLIHKAGGFQGARQSAKDSKRWLLVNIQRDSEFGSHALNRDVWRDDLVENLIREGFIFWQTMDITPDGRTYSERYHVTDYPHVAIIDPRTGKLLWKKEGWTQANPLTAMSFAESAMDFCSKHTFEKLPNAARGGTNPPPALSSGGLKRPFMTEQEQLKAAMAASLKTDGEVVDAEVDDEVEIIEKPDDSKPPAVEVKPLEEKPLEENPPEEKPPEVEAPSLFQQLLEHEVGEEPASGAARVQIRMPNGQRAIRKFPLEQTVKVIFAFVAQRAADEIKQGKEFLLLVGYPHKDLLNSVDETVGSCQLNGEQITVRWKN